MSAVSRTSSIALDLVALHGGLQRADRVDLGDDHPGALAPQRRGAALAHVAVAADQRDLAADHHVGGPVDAVDERVAAAVEVVELRLGHRVVDVDGREQQMPGLLHLVEPVHAGGGLLGDALDALADAVPQLGVLVQGACEQLSTTVHSSESSSVGSGTLPARSYSTPLCTSRVASPPSSRIMFGPSSGQPHSTCSVHHQYSSSVSPFQAKTGTPFGLSTVPSGPTTMAAAAWSWVEKMLHDAQRTSAPSSSQRLDQHRGLDGHVQRAGDAGAAQRLARRRTRPAGP